MDADIGTIDIILWTTDMAQVKLLKSRVGFRAGQTGQMPRGLHQMEPRYPPSPTRKKFCLAAHITPKYILPRGPHSLKSGPAQVNTISIVKRSIDNAIFI